MTNHNDYHNMDREEVELRQSILCAEMDRVLKWMLALEQRIDALECWRDGDEAPTQR